MIRTFRLLRSIAQFANVETGQNHPLARLALVYSENGRGKTTIAAVLRSLTTGDAAPIVERTRLTATSPPQAVVDLTGATAVYQDGAWNSTCPEITVFDDEFVDRNIYSGLAVDPDHRQRLHELIIGTQAVSLNERLRELVERVEQHNASLRQYANAIPADTRGHLSVDDFCALPTVPDVEQKIAETERDLEIARDGDAVVRTPPLTPLLLPPFDKDRIADVLADTLGVHSPDLVAQINSHIDRLGPGAEEWIDEGLMRLHRSNNDHCPFCAQNLAHSPIVSSFETYFSDAYRELKTRAQAWAAALETRHGGDAIASFERAARELIEGAALWRRFVDVPVIALDTAPIATARAAAREAVREALTQKLANPLAAVELAAHADLAIETYNRVATEVDGVNRSIAEANLLIGIAKERVGTTRVPDLRTALLRYRAIRARYDAAVSAHCAAYLAERQAKLATELERRTAREELDALRTSVFPGYQESTNYYLQRLNAGFRLGSVGSVNTRGGPSITYNVVIDDIPVAVSAPSGGGTPSFRTALSAGDRNTLALAFFFALLERSQSLDTTLAVIDDPVSSLDDQRSLATVQEIRRLAERAEQVLVLSHNKPFLCRLWSAADRLDRSAVQLVRVADGSSFQEWRVDEDSASDHDRRDAGFRSYLANGVGDRREVARDIRPHLEAYIRVAHPDVFPPGSLLGQFLATCRDRLARNREILSGPSIEELQDLLDFANRFHHDTNPNWDTEPMSDGELQGAIRRMLRFIES